MGQFDEFTFEIDILPSFNDIFIDFISTFIDYNGGNKCKDDDNKYTKKNNKIIHYMIISIIFCYKKTQIRLYNIFTWDIFHYYHILFTNKLEYGRFVMYGDCSTKSMVWDIAPNGKTRGARTVIPTSFNSIFIQELGRIIISGISEGFHVEKTLQAQRCYFRTKKKCKMTQIV